jgi:hypothetical protein
MRAFIAQTSATEFFVRCTRYDESGIAVARAERAASNQELIVINRRTWEDANANEWSIHSLDSFADSSRAARGVLRIQIVAANGEPMDPRLLHAAIDVQGDATFASFHIDAKESDYDSSIEVTEIVGEESNLEENSICLINGRIAQLDKAISISVTNANGDVREANVPITAPPYTTYEIKLRDVFPDLCSFADGRAVSVSGEFTFDGIWQRPVVATLGAVSGLYHGGNRYGWADTPALKHKFEGGESNPMFVRCDQRMTTIAHLMNTHGGVEHDVAIDCEIFDLHGARIATHRLVAIVSRNRTTSVDISTLLSETTDFVGHVSFRFADSDAKFYPAHLQALMEYRAPKSVARVMAWSDLWNWGERRRHAKPIVSTSHYRVWIGEERRTWVAITNASVERAYTHSAHVTLRLHDRHGKPIAKDVVRTIAPYATLYSPIDELFELYERNVDSNYPALLICESESDLASVQLTEIESGDRWAIEHFLPVYTVTDAGNWWPVGG